MLAHGVKKEHIYFDKIDLVGDAVSLYGRGEMDFDRVVDLTFHSTVGRNDLPVPALRNAGIASAAFVVNGGAAIADVGRAAAALLIGSEPHGLPDHLVFPIR